MSWIAVSGPAATRKLPKLSSVPTGMAAGLIVMVRGCFCLVTTCEKPGGVGCEEQKRPVVTIAGMPYCRRSFCRVSGSRIDPGLMVSVAVPLACSTRVKAAVRIVPVPRAGAEPKAPVRPRPARLLRRPWRR
jgi:hypothetical protein